ncbi:16S rRNA (guanine(966)-N(2))-methyltransferase RsmD [Iodidimonas sp. SYSU 1G8]|uniref:16S rRNA (guanine(966)-N(2))-methyltransferase RsmD n=1 Tax=Iodidimonas sp. SYSU 1G8 TaxID=3133967 RepID=UPI0031FE4728
MRIVGGRFRGLRLKTPEDDRVRPTTDRVRESLFNIIAHMNPPVLRDAVVLDLFAGTGALGLEALSRGAARAVFVDMDTRSLALVRANIDAAKAAALCTVVRADAAQLRPSEVGATLAFLDPPYGKGLVNPALEAAARGGWLSPGATVVIETASGEAVTLPPGFAETDQRAYGGSHIVFARYEP